MERRFDKALLVTSVAETHSHHIMLTGLHEGFRAIGIESELFLLGLDGRGLADFVARAKAADARTFLLDINGRMRMAETRHLKRVVFLIDHPHEHMDRILDAPPGSIVTHVDRAHARLLAALKVPHRVLFVPHAGPPPFTDPPPMADRDIDLLFIGRLEHSPRLEDLREGLSGSAEPVRRVVLDCARATADGTAVFDAFLSACTGIGIAPEAFGMEGILKVLDLAHHWAEAYGRHKLLTALLNGGHRITLIGQVHPDFFGHTPDGLSVHGTMDFAETIEWMKRTRILLNSVTVFPEGSHERIWYGMAAGCVVATDPSTFVSADFVHGREILFWPEDPTAITPMVDNALADPAGLQAMAEAARPIYAEHHTWAERARRIDEALNAPSQ